MRCLCSLLVVLSWLLVGCATPNATRVPANTFSFQDGGHAIYFALHQGEDFLPRREGDEHNAMFVIPGSGCASMGKILPQYFRGLEGESGTFDIFILHKRFIAAESQGERCSDAFVDADHPAQWVADQREFILSRLQRARQVEGVHYRRIVLLGISEGAEIAPVLARSLPVTHVALLGHSGMNALALYRLLASRYPNMQRGWDVLQQGLAAPSGENFRIHGRSRRYWQEVGAIDVEANLVTLPQPLLMGVGTNDPMIPIEVVAALQRSRVARGNPFAMQFFPDADHGLASSAKNQLPDFMFSLDRWLQSGELPFF